MNNSRIDDAILAVAKPDWLKVARVIADVTRVEGDCVGDNDDGFQAIAERIEALVREGRLVAQGNLRKQRYSEVRLPGLLVTEPVTACIRHLRMLSGIKQIWARENNKNPDDLPTWADLRPYLRQRPRCPQRGAYTLGRVEEPPKCSHHDWHTSLT
ncbi:MAG: DUF3658 domain-containing protein [Verrucomicrobia bacterium]|nr:DUF3658 domain-containing protein [Verrucomicrobiota bacterium]